MTQFELDETSSRESLQALREYHEALYRRYRLVGTEALASADVLVGANHYADTATQQEQMPFTD